MVYFFICPICWEKRSKSKRNDYLYFTLMFDDIEVLSCYYHSLFEHSCWQEEPIKRSIYQQGIKFNAKTFTVRFCSLNANWNCIKLTKGTDVSLCHLIHFEYEFCILDFTICCPCISALLKWDFLFGIGSKAKQIEIEFNAEQHHWNTTVSWNMKQKTVIYLKMGEQAIVDR